MTKIEAVPWESGEAQEQRAGAEDAGSHPAPQSETGTAEAQGCIPRSGQAGATSAVAPGSGASLRERGVIEPPAHQQRESAYWAAYWASRSIRPMRVLVTGACGYKGSVLVPKLRAAGHEVVTLDIGWFGGIPDIRVDTRDINGIELPDVEAIIHLAGIANDPCGELDSKLTWEINVLGTLLLAEKAVRAGIKRFIFASSASVYGIKGNDLVTEDTYLEPVSDYNKTKMVGERVLLSYADRMNVQIVRPATICGLSPRMRLDVVVNMLTIRAIEDGHMHLMTPGLYRPHCHIQDVCDLYVWLLERPEVRGTFNASFENQTIRETAELIAEHVGCPITEGAPSMDKRSYLVDSSKLLAAGFKPRYGTKDAVREIVDAVRSGALVEDERMVNLSWMRKKGLVSG